MNSHIPYDYYQGPETSYVKINEQFLSILHRTLNILVILWVYKSEKLFLKLPENFYVLLELATRTV